MSSSNIDRRVFTGRTEVREAATSRDASRIIGYGAPFNVETIIGGGGKPFRETIRPGAFQSVIAADVRGLFNHDANFVLGRTGNHTMRLVEDAGGLRYEIDVNRDDRSALDVVAKIQRGDVTGSSFGFRVKRDEWTGATRSGELPLRTIYEIAELVDVGPVTFPAYAEASAEARDRAAELSVPGARSSGRRVDGSGDADRLRWWRLAKVKTATASSSVTVEDDRRRSRWRRTLVARPSTDRQRVARYRALCATLRA